jgi:diadenosine tetraphosphate (Ap4A) HIT family hydrolase
VRGFARTPGRRLASFVRLQKHAMPHPACLSCAIIAGATETLGGAILETPNFHAHQDFACPIPGFVIVAAKRHVRCLDELSQDEAAELAHIAHRIRGAQRTSLGLEHVYYIYNEDTTAHLHLWLVPRFAWMNEFGHSVESLRPILVHAKEHMTTPAHLAEVLRCVGILRSALAA